MSRIYWDTMLLIYLTEDHPVYNARVARLLGRVYERGDSLFTSYLALGELMTGDGRFPPQIKSGNVPDHLRSLGFSFLTFDEGAVLPFSKLRAIEKLKVADSIHLACAASAGIDLFLTGDKQLMRLHVPGIQFIADFDTPVL
jgi:uncharacterized protein